jgi:hypothetical protein
MDAFVDDAFVFTMACVLVCTTALFTRYLTGAEFVSVISILAALWHFGDWKRCNGGS